MFSEYDTYLEGSVDGDGPFFEQMIPSTSGIATGEVMPRYVVAEDDAWVQPLSEVVYQEDTGPSPGDPQYDIQRFSQQVYAGDEVYLMPVEEHEFDELTESVGNLQVAAHEVVEDEMVQAQVEPIEYMQSLSGEMVQDVPTYLEPSQIIPVGNSRVRYIVQQQQPQLYEVPQNAHVQCEIRPKAMFEGTSCQRSTPVKQRPIAVTRSRSRSQPRRPEDVSLVYLTQEYDEAEWDGVELEDHEYFIGEGSAILADDDGGSNLPAPKIQQRPYFPPNLSPTEKKDYLLMNYRKACERYFPFANTAMLAKETIYKPVEAFASDLYRFHARGAHIHGFFRTVINSTDPPSHDQTRYIQDIHFGKVFPLFPDYDEWDEQMKDDFRQLTSSLLKLFERKCFYANAKSGVGKIPVVKRGPRPQPKPPPEYVEQQKITSEGLPKGFHSFRASAVRANQSRLSQANPVAATGLTELPQPSSSTEQISVPKEVGAARVEALEFNKRANVKRLVDDAFVTREQEASFVEYEALPSDSRTFVCRVPPGPSKTLRDQRSTGRKAVRMIQNGTIEASIDRSGRYVVNLDDIRGQRGIPYSQDISRHVHRPAYSLREMVASARRGAANYAKVQARVRAQGPRYSRIDQLPRSVYRSGIPLAARDHLSENAAPMQNSVRNDVYLRSSSCGRVGQPLGPVYGRSSSSGGSARNVADLDNTEEGPLTQDVYTNDSSTSIVQDDTADVIVSQSRDENPGAPSQSRDHVCEENSALPPSPVKNQKRGILLRDENGRLRRGFKLPDGTIILGKPRYKEPTAGGVYVMHSMGRSDERGVQWKRIQEPFGLHGRSQEGERTEARNVKNKTRRTKQSESEAATDSAPGTESRRRRRFSARHCAIDQISPHRIPQWSEEELKNFNRKRLLKQKEEDEENIFVDVVSTDTTTEDAIKELIAPAPPPPTANGISDGGNVKKPGRPHKKCRGRLARQKQAIKDAEIAEKIAIKHRELPVLDLALKIIEDPSVEELLDMQEPVDAHLLHEVGDVLKEMIAQISLEELEPKRDIKPRCRRTWDYLPRIRSKRQEYKKQNVPVSERSPPPPPLTVKPRGRNAEKYRKAIAEQEHGHDEDVSPNVDPTTKAPFEKETSEDSGSSEAKVLDPHSVALLDGHEPQPQEVILCPEGPINDEDLVDIVDPFFSDALTISNSYEEDETQSQNALFQKSISDAVTPDESPLEFEPLQLEKRVFEMEVAELPTNSNRSPLADFPEVRSTSLGTEMLSVDAEPFETIYVSEEHGDLCRRVEAMLDVLQNFCEETAGVFVHVGSSASASNDERLSYLRNEPAITATSPFELDTSLLREEDTQNVGNELSEGYDVFMAAEVVSESVLFEAKAKPQESSTVQGFAIANLAEDRLYICADVDVGFSPLMKLGDEASASHTRDLIAVENLYLSARWEENFVEGVFDFCKENEFVDIVCQIPLIVQEMEMLSVLNSTLVATAPVDGPLAHSDSITLYEAISIHDSFAFSICSVDLAIERSLVEHESMYFSIPTVEEKTALLSIVDWEASLYFEEEYDETLKSLSIPRVGDSSENSLYATGVVENLLSERAPPRSKNLDSILGTTISKDLMGFLLKLFKVIGKVLVESLPRVAKTVTHMVRSPLKRKYVADGSGEEYELPSKRKRIASDDSAQFSSFQTLSADLSKALELVDTTSKFRTKSKRRKTARKHRASTVHQKADEYVHRPQSHGSRMVTAEIDAISEYLRSDDLPHTACSSLTHLESSFIASPDLFGISELVKRSKLERKRGSKEIVKRKEAEALTTAHHRDKPRTVLRIRKLATEFNIKRVGPDCRCGRNIGFFGRRLLELSRHLRDRQYQKSVMDISGMDFHKITSYRTASVYDSVACRTSRERNYQISDFDLISVRLRNPVVKFDIDVAPLLESLNPVSPSCLSLPRAEGSLEHAVEQFENGIGCILNQVDHARTIIEKLRDKMHWSLHYLMDAQLSFLDVLYEMWGFTARTIQIAVFSIHQASLWEKHSEFFDARMYRLLYDINASAALCCNIDVCASCLRKFEEWCRDSGNFTSIYNHVHGLALSLIKLITVPDILKRLQRKTLWNAKALSSSENEELFSIDLAPFFQIGTCPFKGTEFDFAKVLDVRMPLVNTTLEDVINFGTAQDSSSYDVFSFLFPSQAIVELCRKQIFDEIQTYYHSHNMDSITSLSNRELYVLSPIARAYIVSRVTEARAQSHMRNHVMNIEKLIEKLNSLCADLDKSVEMHNEAEFSYPCGQVVFGFDGGTVKVRINKPGHAYVPQPSNEAMEEAQRIMGSFVHNTIFHPLMGEQVELSVKSSLKKEKSAEAVKNWVASIPEVTMDEVEDTELQAFSCQEECMDVVYPNSPARVQIIDDEDDDTEIESYHLPLKKCCDADAVTKVIAGRTVQFTVDCEQGFVKLRTLDSTPNDGSTDDLANTFSTASFTSFDQVETLKIIRSKETGELDWMAMIQYVLDAPPFPETLPRFMLKKELSDRKILDVMNCHEYANHFVHETDEAGEFLDQRKEMREKIKQFQKIDYYERRRNAEFEKISSSAPLEMPRPSLLDQFPAYGIWVHKVALYAEDEKKRLIDLKPFDNEPCRAARPELVRGLSEPKKQRKRSASAVSWFGRTMREHFGDYLELGMSRLQYEKAQSGKEWDKARNSSPADVITNLFINKSNAPTTLVDPAELIEKPYAYFRPTNPSRKRRASPVLSESTLVKRFPDCPLLAPLGVADDDKENILPPEPDGSDSDDDEDD